MTRSLFRFAPLCSLALALQACGPSSSDPRRTMQASFVGDLDDDGVSEICVSAMAFVPSGSYRAKSSAVIVSGATGAVHTELFRSSTVKRVCDASVALGDVNGDGAGDVALLINLRGNNFGNDARELRIESGRGGEPLALLELGGGASEQSQICTVGDLNGDGVRELLLATGDQYDADPEPKRVRVLSGKTLATLREHAFPSADQRCAYVESLGDVSKDGADDYCLGWFDVEARGMRATVVSGRDGALLREHSGAWVMRKLAEDTREEPAHAYVLSRFAKLGDVGWELVDGRDGTILSAHSAAGLHRSDACSTCSFLLEMDRDLSEMGISHQMPRVDEAIFIAFPLLADARGSLITVQHAGWGPQRQARAHDSSVHWRAVEATAQSELPADLRALVELEDARLVPAHSPDGSAVPRFALTKTDEKGAALWIEREGRLVKLADV